VVFPALRASVPAAGTGMVTSLEEHEEINSLLDEMLGLDPSCFGFMKRTSALILELRAHFAEEEELFGRLRAALDPASSPIWPAGHGRRSPAPPPSRRPCAPPP
jgi:hypothetical protein